MTNEDLQSSSTPTIRGMQGSRRPRSFLEALGKADEIINAGKRPLNDHLLSGNEPFFRCYFFIHLGHLRFSDGDPFLQRVSRRFDLRKGLLGGCHDSSLASELLFARIDIASLRSLDTLSEPGHENKSSAITFAALGETPGCSSALHDANVGDQQERIPYPTASLSKRTGFVNSDLQVWILPWDVLKTTQEEVYSSLS
jgi:hypothetical protein